jgi:hypothetical protein
MLNAMICLLDGWNPSTGRHRCNRNGKVGENKWNNERRKRINRHLPARHLAASVIADEAVAGRKLTLILSRYSRQANNRTNQRDSAHVVGIADGKLLPPLNTSVPKDMRWYGKYHPTPLNAST